MFSVIKSAGNSRGTNTFGVAYPSNLADAANVDVGKYNDLNLCFADNNFLSDTLSNDSVSPPPRPGNFSKRDPNVLPNASVPEN